MRDRLQGMTEACPGPLLSLAPSLLAGGAGSFAGATRDENGRRFNAGERRFASEALSMPTISQLIRKPRLQHTTSKRRPNPIPASRSVASARVHRTMPKTPNSALRIVGNVRLTDGFEVMGYISSESHKLREHSRSWCVIALSCRSSKALS